MAQLTPGLTKDQVQFLIGLPVLEGESTDTKWIYPMKQEDESYKNLIVNFADGIVTNVVQPD
jgi:outer membrane protein assembly factor BamE (lipoprotein component of BamABCDE complex)